MAHVFFEKLENRKSTQVLWAGYSAPSNYYSAYYGHPTIINQDYYPYLSAINAYNAAPVLNYRNYFPWNSPYYPSEYFHPYNSYPYWYNTFNSYPQWNFGIGNWFSPVWNMFQGLFGGWNLQGTLGQQSEQSTDAMDRIENAIKMALTK